MIGLIAEKPSSKTSARDDGFLKKNSNSYNTINNLTFMIMPATILTTDDLYQFKTELFDEIKSILSNSQNSKRYLRSSDVMELLQLSPGTLQNLRVNGTLPYTKLGGIIYYDEDDINRVLEQNRFEI